MSRRTFPAVHTWRSTRQGEKTIYNHQHKGISIEVYAPDEGDWTVVIWFPDERCEVELPDSNDPADYIAYLFQRKDLL